MSSYMHDFFCTWTFSLEDCNAVASSRSTPLRVACRFKNEAMVRLLLKYGADVQTKSSSDSLLHVIALYSTVGIAEVG